MPYIDEASELFIKAKDKRHDFKQDFILKCYRMEDRLIEAKSKDNLNGFVFITFKNYYLDSKKKKQLETTALNGIELSTEDTEQKYSNIKPHAEMLSLLTNHEQIFINRLIECRLNVLEMSRLTGMSRKTIRLRRNKIYEKWKRLDIYLPQSL